MLTVSVALAALLAQTVSQAATFTVDTTGGSTTLSDVTKGHRVTATLTLIAPTDLTDCADEAEAVATGATATIDGNPVTVTLSKLTATLKFRASQNKPSATITVQTAACPAAVAGDGDEGGATLVWHSDAKDTGDPPCDGKCNDPINALTGNSFQTQVDYVGAGAFPLTFTRFYNSLRSDTPAAFGAAWSHSYNLFLDSRMHRAEGPAYDFGPNGLDADAPVLAAAFTGCPGACYLNKSTNVLESYDGITGRLTALYDLKGNSQTLAYDAAGRLVSVTHSSGRSLQFTYDASNRIQSMTDPAGAVYTYGYDANNNLTSVRNPDGSVRQYVYGDPAFPNAMTALVDENGNTYATWTYDANGYATTSSVGGGLVVETASSPDLNSDIHTITNPATGTTRTLVAVEINGKQLVNTATFSDATGANSVSKGSTYDATGSVTSRINKNGTMDCFQYSGPEQEFKAIFNAKLDQFSTCAQDSDSYGRSTEWHPRLYARTVVAQPSRITYTLYHEMSDPSNGYAQAICVSPAFQTFGPYTTNLVCQTKVFATTDPSGVLGTSSNMINTSVPAKTASFTYDPYGRLLTATDALGNVTTYAYYQDTTADHTVGDLQSISNALKQVTTFGKYDRNGRVLQTIDPNGLVQVLTYDYRGHVLTRQVGALTTTYAYDAAGQLQSVQQPDGTTTTSSYDAAHRPQAITDAAGNTTNYSYDASGNISGITVKDAAANTAQSTQYVYDYMNNIVKSVGAPK